MDEGKKKQVAEIMERIRGAYTVDSYAYGIVRAALEKKLSVSVVSSLWAMTLTANRGDDCCECQRERVKAEREKEESEQIVDDSWSPIAITASNDVKDGETLESLADKLADDIETEGDTEERCECVLYEECPICNPGMVDKCPGCGTTPGDGLTDTCKDPDGCEYWRTVAAPRVEPGQDPTSKTLKRIGFCKDSPGYKHDMEFTYKSSDGLKFFACRHCNHQETRRD